MSRKSCEGCVYYRELCNSNKSSKCCHYLLMTEEKRDCPADNCNKKLVVSKEEETEILKAWYKKVMHQSIQEHHY